MSSFFLMPYQRFNIGMWGKRSFVISYNMDGPDHTLMIFSNSYEVEIPGGLKGYTVGSIGKLVSLQNKPLIYKKALSAASQVLIHKTLHQNTNEVYFDDYGDSSDDESLKSMIAGYLFGPGELNIFERLYIYIHLSDIVSSKSTRILVTSQKPDVKIFEKSFRNERKLVQLIYRTSSKTGYELASMLENNGIRVADILEYSPTSTDLAEYAKNGVEKCLIIESSPTFSKTSDFLSSYFGCEKIYGETGLYNIKLILDEKTEKEWGS
ncbi:MAG: hypothetical protein U0525_06215 [Patescibacteria group bacterium]